MNRVEDALKTPASELIKAANRPATTIPLIPTGRTAATRRGKACCAFSFSIWPLLSKSASEIISTLPVSAKAKQIIPGIIKMNTGKSLRKAAAIVPLRASVRFADPRSLCTIY